jgi:hypothetical protein
VEEGQNFVAGQGRFFHAGLRPVFRGRYTARACETVTCPQNVDACGKPDSCRARRRGECRAHGRAMQEQPAGELHKCSQTAKKRLGSASIFPRPS